VPPNFMTRREEGICRVQRTEYKWSHTQDRLVANGT
jgi:hypothetical protein